MLGNIFKIFEYKKILKEGSENPGKLAKEETRGLIYAFGIVPILLSIGILIVLFILGFTNVITDSSLLAKVFFFIILFATSIFLFVLKGIANFSGKIAENTTNTLKEGVMSKSTRGEKVHTTDYTIK